MNEPTSPQTPTRDSVTSSDLLGWLRGKLTEAEVAVRAREQMADTWRHGSDEMWKAAAELHPSTSGKALDRPARLTEAKKHARIAGKLRRDVGMYRATLAALSPPNS